MVCIVFHVRVVLEVAPELTSSLILEVLHVLVWSEKYVCDPKLISSRDRSWLCKALVA